MWKIITGLFLGDREDACDLKQLRQEKITHIVNCAHELPCYFPEEFVYLWSRMKDPDLTFASQIPHACEFINKGRAQGQVLVHCTAAVSRSPAVILAYLCYQGTTLDQAAQQLSSIVLTGIDEIFLRQLVEYIGTRLSAHDLQHLAFKLLGSL